ncbi:MAG TPA: tetratricopeptide repeat protein [Myxococcaceae bacterium]|nr:tetratricopeptide repeat protein [Myxococcaceae bacterium]
MHLGRTASVTPLLASLLLATPAMPQAGAAKVPITTSSEEARQLYVQGRDFVEKLRMADGYPLFEKAVAKDPGFALGYFGLASAAPTNQTFFNALRQAVALAGKVSEGERLMILGLDAGVNGNPEGQRTMYTLLVEKFPGDERALTLLGNFYFAQQKYPAAIEHLAHAVKIAPQYTAAYNQLGYAYRFEGKYAEAEKTFQKYIEVLPGDPNPHDSYAELLMKLGRFEESIASYRKALEVDPTFTASLVGIANDQMFLGQGDEARKTLRQLTAISRNDGEARQALFWTAQSYVLEGRYPEAVKAVQEERAIAERSGDFGAQSQDTILIGNIWLKAGKTDTAASSFAEAVTLMGKASVPPEVKEANRRNSLFNGARVTLARGDLKGARAQAAEFARQVEVKRIPFEIWQVHELNGMIAIAGKDYELALTELGKSTDQNPRVLYLTAVALQGKGDRERARAAAKAAADFNALNGLYAFVRPEAKRMLAGS